MEAYARVDDMPTSRDLAIQVGKIVAISAPHHQYLAARCASTLILPILGAAWPFEVAVA